MIHVHDITESFIEHVIGRGDESLYEASFPELFEHYFRFSGARQGYPSGLTAEGVRELRDRIRRQLPDIEDRFVQAGFGLDHVKIVLFVGQDRSNGHALVHGDSVIVWLPVETYRSSLSVKIFVPHEIVHALHYQNSPAFWFRDVEDRNHVGQQLVTEGTATLLSKEIMGVDQVESLWADYVSRDWAGVWLRKRKACLHNLAAHALKTFDTSPPDNSFFWFTGYMDDDVLRNRSGYLVGMEVIRAIKEHFGLSPMDLLKIERGRMDLLAKDILQRMTKSQQPAAADG
jgi:hypothetical protein